jgi:hypothetical protein
MARMTRQEFWRCFNHGHGLAALFVDFEPVSVRDETRIAQYAFFARGGAIVLLCVVVATVFDLAKTGHPWAGLSLVGFTILMTVGQVINHRVDHRADGQ